ncbi:unnamed protein product [Arctogadus glacialis]
MHHQSAKFEQTAHPLISSLPSAESEATSGSMCENNPDMGLTYSTQDDGALTSRPVRLSLVQHPETNRGCPQTRDPCAAEVSHLHVPAEHQEPHSL